MNPPLHAVVICRLTLLLSWLSLVQPSAFGQGQLAPLFKTLQQVEPRTPISSLPLLISQPGADYLTTNLTVTNGHGTTINTNAVTLDLNGFTIPSIAATPAGNGVNLNGSLQDITIPNGTSAVGSCARAECFQPALAS